MNLKSINKLSVGRGLHGWRSLSRGATLFWEHNRTKGDGEHLIHFFTYITLMGVSGSVVSSESPWNKGANAKYPCRGCPHPRCLSENISYLPPSPLFFSVFHRTVHYSFAFFLIAAEPLSKVALEVPLAMLAVVGVTTPAPVVVVEDLLYPAC